MSNKYLPVFATGLLHVLRHLAASYLSRHSVRPACTRPLRHQYHQAQLHSLEHLNLSKHQNMTANASLIQQKLLGIGEGVGIRTWKVEKFELVDVPESQKGEFYTGDSYLVLQSYQDDGRSRIQHNIFFWLGAETTQDEAGSIAIFATQLDDALGGAPVQYREVQGNESDAFLELFPRIQYLAGGSPSGFKKVEPKVHEAKLFQITATSKDGVRMREVPLSAASLDADDAFVLNAGQVVYVWYGPGCNIREKTKAMQVATEIRAGEGSKMVVVEPDDRSSSEAQAFFKVLA